MAGINHEAVKAHGDKGLHTEWNADHQHNQAVECAANQICVRIQNEAHEISALHLIIHHFVNVCVNKFDLNREISHSIEEYCGRNGLRFVGRIPYDTVVTKAMIHRRSIVEYSDGAVAQSVRTMWENVSDALMDTEGSHSS